MHHAKMNTSLPNLVLFWVSSMLFMKISVYLTNFMVTRFATLHSVFQQIQIVVDNK